MGLRAKSIHAPFWVWYLFVCFKWSSKRNSLTTHLGMVICTHYLTRVYSKLTQGHFLKTFTSFRKCHFKDHVCLDKSFLDSTVFALAFFELWERTNWHPVSNTQRLNSMNWIKGYYMIVKVKNETFWFSTYSMEMHSLTLSSFIICLRGETFGSRTILSMRYLDLLCRFPRRDTNY